MNFADPKNRRTARERQIEHATSVLFPHGPPDRLESSFLEKSGTESEAQQQLIKAAFRKRILETHPDRALVLGKPEKQLEREFLALTNAYRFLCSLPKPKMVISEHSRRPHDFFLGSIPQKKLRFAEYLYYSGRVSRQAFLESLAWQQAQRPLIGKIAINFGFISENEVFHILESRHYQKKFDILFGEYALQQGIITKFQQLAMIGQQRRMQKKIGRFFVERNIITLEEVSRVLICLTRHNLHSCP